MSVVLNVFSAFIVSVIVTILSLMIDRRYKLLPDYKNPYAVQKMHKSPTPRVGGFSVFAGFFLVVLYNLYCCGDDKYAETFLLSAFIVFLLGIVEDLTESMPPLLRLFVIIGSAILAIYETKALLVITNTGFDGLNHLVIRYPFIGVSLSLFCVVGLTNAFNIIDGFNGLAATTAMVNLMGIISATFFLNDCAMLEICELLFAAILGFWIFNYPSGKIFLGDGGAYTIGFIIAIISIYIPHAHKGLISPYAFLLMAIYPVTEMGFSMYRRKIFRRSKCMRPDAMHLHHLIYFRCTPHSVENRNARVLPLMLFFIIPQTILALIFYRSTIICLLLILLYVIVYVFSYFSLVRFKTFGFLKILLK
ncbi:MAG: hypothetical protein K0R14_1435 [Burkholderiales bacterium]|jgi:UDP-N-acetylmuramyl pentapeptide phosphotransferase/UDP-N-acetylglucosamine-1-phosphate transferase|nr:hypothetical protein [Burkholderiales bacterium]